MTVTTPLPAAASRAPGGTSGSRASGTDASSTEVHGGSGGSGTSAGVVAGIVLGVLLVLATAAAALLIARSRQKHAARRAADQDRATGQAGGGGSAGPIVYSNNVPPRVPERGPIAGGRTTLNPAFSDYVVPVDGQPAVYAAAKHTEAAAVYAAAKAGGSEGEGALWAGAPDAIVDAAGSGSTYDALVSSGPAMPLYAVPTTATGDGGQQHGMRARTKSVYAGFADSQA